MKENWTKIQKLPRKEVPGNTPLGSINQNDCYTKRMVAAGFEDEDIQELNSVFNRLSLEYVTISDLRSALVNNPKALKLNEVTTKTLFALIQDKMSANLYK